MAQLVSGLGGPAGYGEIRYEPGAIIDTFDVSAVFETDFLNNGRVLESGQLAVRSEGTAFFGPLNHLATNAFFNPYGGLFDDFGNGVYNMTPIWVDVDAAADKVTVTWEDALVFRSSGRLSMQLELADLGNNQLGVTFRYGASDVERMKIASTGVFGFGYRIDTNLSREQELADFGDTPGNTGQPGIWEWVINVGPVNGTNQNDHIRGTNQGETIYGLDGDDWIRGLFGSDIIDGGNGDDRLFGDRGDDRISGGDGDDRIEGGRGNDHLNGGGGNNDIRGGNGDDVITAGAGRARIDGGFGADRVEFSDATQGLVIDLMAQGKNDGAAKGVRLYSVEHIITTDFDDIVIGGTRRDEIETGDGDDLIDGRGGYDTIDAGAGDDTVFYYGEFGSIVGGQGFDTLNFQNWNSGITLKWTGGLFYSDRVYLSGFERYVGTAMNDVLAFTRWFEGVRLEGAQGQDRLRGSAHDDHLSGGKSRDWLMGDEGDDILTGGAGSDVFLFTLPGFRDGPIGHDVITDFNAAEDSLKIRLADVAGVESFAGTVGDLYAQFASVTASGITLAFSVEASVELVGASDLAAAIAATEFI